MSKNHKKKDYVTTLHINRDFQFPTIEFIEAKAKWNSDESPGEPEK